MSKYNNLKLGTFLKTPPTEYIALFIFWLLEPQSNGGWRKLGRVLPKMKKKFRGGVFTFVSFRFNLFHIRFISFHFVSFPFTFVSFFFISFHIRFILFHFVSFCFILFHFVSHSFHFVSFCFISFHFVSFGFISFHIRFISFHFVSHSFHFISFDICFISYRFTPLPWIFATLGSILYSQLSWESGKSQLARWSHNVALFSTMKPPTHPVPIFFFDLLRNLGSWNFVCNINSLKQDD